MSTQAYAYKIMPSPVGDLKLVASATGLAAVLWPEENPRRVRLGQLVENPDHPILVEAEHELQAYFSGALQTFTVKLDMTPGTPFQQKIWAALRTIPFGETRTYSQIATQVGLPTAIRAVGAANGRNPVSIITPCHRVLGMDGKLTGFAGGLATKAHLLALEKRAQKG